MLIKSVIPFVSLLVFLNGCTSKYYNAERYQQTTFCYPFADTIDTVTSASFFDYLIIQKKNWIAELQSYKSFLVKLEVDNNDSEKREVIEFKKKRVYFINKYSGSGYLLEYADTSDKINFRNISKKAINIDTFETNMLCRVRKKKLSYSEYRKKIKVVDSAKINDHEYSFTEHCVALDSSSTPIFFLDSIKADLIVGNKNTIQAKEFKELYNNYFVVKRSTVFLSLKKLSNDSKPLKILKREITKIDTINNRDFEFLRNLINYHKLK